MYMIGLYLLLHVKEEICGNVMSVVLALPLVTVKRLYLYSVYVNVVFWDYFEVYTRNPDYKSFAIAVTPILMKY